MPQIYYNDIYDYYAATGVSECSASYENHLNVSSYSYITEELQIKKEQWSWLDAKISKRKYLEKILLRYGNVLSTIQLDWEHRKIQNNTVLA